MSPSKSSKTPEWVQKALENVLVRVVLAMVAAGAVGGSGYAFGDAGAADHVTKTQADSIATVQAKAEVAPLVDKVNRMDTAVMSIKFSLDVMMTDAQKLRADSMMRAALRNINYGGSP